MPNKEIITISDHTVEIHYKRIKNIHLRVYPPSGDVKVSAPFHTSKQMLLSFLISRVDWIEKQKKKISLKYEDSVKEFVTGETHAFLGEQYILEIREVRKKPSVQLEGKNLVLQVRPGQDTSKREEILYTWYRSQLKELIPSIIEKHERSMNVKVSSFGIKRMKTRWGTCNLKTRKIWLNLELAKDTLQRLESVVVHEMVHLLEPSHNKRFYRLMDQYYPQWIK